MKCVWMFITVCIAYTLHVIIFAIFTALHYCFDIAVLQLNRMSSSRALRVIQICLVMTRKTFYMKNNKNIFSRVHRSRIMQRRNGYILSVPTVHFYSNAYYNIILFMDNICHMRVYVREEAMASSELLTQLCQLMANHL